MPDFGHPSFLELRRSGGPVWWSILVRAGVVKSVPSGSRFGNKSIATDGHLCLSILEWKFCELLHLAGIPHIREPRYSADVERIWKRGVIGLEDIDAFRVVNDPEKVEDS
jgi:hypothetical protein